MLTNEEKFRFDLEGYLVIPGVLSIEECAALSAQCDDHWPRQPEDGHFRRTADISIWGKPFLDLMDSRRRLPRLFPLGVVDW